MKKVTSALCLILLLATAEIARAQGPTIQLRPDMVPGVGMLANVELLWEKPIGRIEEPQPGQATEVKTRNWLLSAGARGGLFWDWDGDRLPKSGPNIGAQLGIVRRTPWKFEQIGAHAVFSLRPLAYGPSVSTRILVVDLQTGVVWVRDYRGARWFAGIAIPAALIGDLFKR